MALSGNDRAAAIYNAVSAQSGFAHLTATEQATVKAQLQTLYGADTSYLTQAAVILPDTLSNNAGQAVQVTPASGTGTTVSPQTIIGTGKLS